MKDSKRWQLYVAGQCLIMFNCFLCFLEIYAEHLIPVSCVIIASAIILFLVSGVYRSFRLSYSSVICLILIGWLVLSDIIKADLSTLTSQMCLSSMALFFLFSFFSPDLDKSRCSVNSVLWVSFILATLASVISLIMKQGYPDDFTGITNNRNALAAYAELGIMAGVGLMVFRKKISIISFVNLLGICINIFVIYRTQSRTPLMALSTFAVILVLFGVYSISTKGFRKFITLLLAVILCCLLVTFVLRFVINRNGTNEAAVNLYEMLNKISSGRIQIWNTCLDIAKEHPLLGAKESIYHEIMTAGRGYPNGPHNVYFSLLTLNGIPALAIYLVMIVYVLFSSIRTMIRTQRSERLRIICYFAILAGLLVGDLFECLSIRTYMPTAYLLILLIAALESERRAL